MNYNAVTRKELEERGRGMYIGLKKTFHRKGLFRIDDEQISFEGWRTIKMGEIQSVVLCNDDFFSSFQLANGYRLFFCRSAKPIRIILIDGESIYFYVDWNFFTGLSKNVQVYKEILQHMQNVKEPRGL